MHGYSLDSVRDSFIKDMDFFLDRIDESAGMIHGDGACQSIESDCHSVYGIAAMVGADALARCARVCEYIVGAQTDPGVTLRPEQTAEAVGRMLPNATALMRRMARLEVDGEHTRSGSLEIEWRAIMRPWHEILLRFDQSEIAEHALKSAPLTVPGPDAAWNDLFADEESAPKAPAEPNADETQFMPSTEMLQSRVFDFSSPDESAYTAVAEQSQKFVSAEFGAAPDLWCGLPACAGRMPAPQRLPAPSASNFAPAVEAAVEAEAIPCAPLALDSVDVELLEVFRLEAREIVVSLQGFFRTLATPPHDPSCLKNLERLYHTLKGAAATVGLEPVSTIAQELGQALMPFVDTIATVPPDLVPHLINRTNDLLELAGLPRSIEAEVPARKPEPKTQSQWISKELRVIYIDEAHSILTAAAAQLALLFDAQPDEANRRRRREARNEIGRLLHRLKGTSLLNKDSEIFIETERLQGIAQSESPTAEILPMLEIGLRRVAENLAKVSNTEPVEIPHSKLSERAAPAEEPAIPTPAPVAAQASNVHSPDDSVASGEKRAAVELEPDPEIRQAFEVEFQELMHDIEQAVIGLEENVQPQKALSSLMRHFHTLKGAVNSIGLAPMGQYVHLVEDFLESLLSAPILPPLHSISRFLLLVEDRLRKNWREAQQGFVATDVGELLAALSRISASGVESSMAELPPVPSRASVPSRADTEAKVSKVPAPMAAAKLESEPASDAGAAVESAPKSAPPSAKNAREPDAHRSRRGSKDAGAAEEAESSDRQWIRVPTRRLDFLMNMTGELVVARSRMQRRVAMLRSIQRELTNRRKRLLTTVDNFKERYEFNLAVSPNAPRRGTATQNREEKVKLSQPATEGAPTSATAQNGMAAFTELELDHYDEINILARGLNEIGNDISEIQQQIYDALDHFSEDSDVFSHIVSELQGELTRARMVSVNQLFARLRRPIWDACDSEGKQVRVVVQGEVVDLDKTIMDGLYLPMLHLVRNAVAHGIESPAERARGGKDAAGAITLSARQESGRILLEVADDGGGIDLETLRNRGIARGLIAANTPVDSPQVLDLIFAPGISTRYSAGNVSGRGVGCDIVKREIERMNGQITVQSTAGGGTRFLITLPLTLAISHALMVQCAGQTFAIPLQFAERTLDLANTETITSAGAPRVRIDDTYLVVRDLASLIGANPEVLREGEEPAARNDALILRFGDRRELIRVERVLGQQEIVVKSLGDVVSGHPLFSGVTIGGEGDLILILDIARLLEHIGAESAGEEGESGRGSSESGSEGHDAAHEAAKLRVLFTDDSLSVRKVAEKLLLNMGVEATMAVDGVDALEKLRQGTFDMVFTDLEMPRMHGFDLIREMRFIPAFKDIPVVVVTSRSSEKHRAQAMAVGANDYVTKPFTQDILEQKLRQWSTTSEVKTTAGERSARPIRTSIQARPGVPDAKSKDDANRLREIRLFVACHEWVIALDTIAIDRILPASADGFEDCGAGSRPASTESQAGSRVGTLRIGNRALPAWDLGRVLGCGDLDGAWVIVRPPEAAAPKGSARPEDKADDRRIAIRTGACLSVGTLPDSAVHALPPGIFSAPERPLFSGAFVTKAHVPNSKGAMFAGLVFDLSVRLH